MPKMTLLAILLLALAISPSTISAGTQPQRHGIQTHELQQLLSPNGRASSHAESHGGAATGSSRQNAAKQSSSSSSTPMDRSIGDSRLSNNGSNRSSQGRMIKRDVTPRHAQHGRSSMRTGQKQRLLFKNNGNNINAGSRSGNGHGNGQNSKGMVADSRQEGRSSTSAMGSSQSRTGRIRSSECKPGDIVQTKPVGPAIPPLPQGVKPNFIVIMTDDQGWDDIGLHNPKYIKTPNLDKFIQRGTKFDNFYVNTQCAQSRAELYTGRSSARTGVMLVHGGYDFINKGEVTSAQFMAAAGYKTAHVGKWHNNNMMSYEPWSMSFQESWYPSSPTMYCLMRQNATYYQAEGYTEDLLITAVMDFVKNEYHSMKTSNGPVKPFYLSYTPHAIHLTNTPQEQLREFPSRFKLRYQKEPKYKGIPGSTLDAWAMLEYLDDTLRRLFDFLEKTGLSNNTYVLLMSDNGSYLHAKEERDEGKHFRMPSRMQGFKSDISEGGIRNFLVVRGPGVTPGVTDSTLLSMTDILPTMADLAGVNTSAIPHKQWDGMSFKNLLLPKSSSSGGSGSGSSSSGLHRGTSLATQRQRDRFVFAMSPFCWEPNAVPLLGPDRKVLKPQPLLDYERGGMQNTHLTRSIADILQPKYGFERCIAVRWKDYKWVGATRQVYRLVNGSHVELPCNEVTGEEAARVGSIMSNAARRYWASVLNEPHSFSKPTFFIGVDGQASNVVAMGAHERTAGSITLLSNGAKGFRDVGDRMCFKLQVMQAGTYDAYIMYTSGVAAFFKLSVGTYGAIMNGTAASVEKWLRVENVMRTRRLGTMGLHRSNGQHTEACLELVRNSEPGKYVFKTFSDLRFTPSTATMRRSPHSKSAATAGTRELALAAAADAIAASGSTSNSSRAVGGNTTSSVQLVSESDPEQVLHAPDLSALHAETTKRMRTGLAGEVKKQLDWDTLRARCGWPEGQGDTLDSMYSPYDVEDIDKGCEACQPPV